MRLLLVRHGQTSWNIGGRAQGHTDIALDPTGLDQARRVGEAFLDYPVDRVLSSDLVRAAETAGAIAKGAGVAVEQRADLRERCFGEWEGLPFAEVTGKMQERAIAHGVIYPMVCPPGGESFQDVWDRLEPLHQELRVSDDTIAIVSHGGALSVLLAKLIGGTLETSRAFRFSNTGITELERRAEGFFYMLRYNDTSHLSADWALGRSLDGVSR